MTMPTDRPRSHVCAVCCSSIPEPRFDAGSPCCRARCQRIHDRTVAAERSGDPGKLARARAVKAEVLRESLARAADRAAATPGA